MTGVWSLVPIGLWVAGLAAALATLSVAHFRAASDRVPFRIKLREPGFQAPLHAGLLLFCLGLLFGGRTWWEWTAWGLLCSLSALLAGRSWKRARAGLPTASALESLDRGRIRRAGLGLVVAGTVVIGTWAMLFCIQLVQRSRSVQAHMRALEEIAAQVGRTEGDSLLEAAGSHVAGAHADLEALRDLVGPLLPLGRLMRWLPKYGGDFAASSDLMLVALGVSSAGDRTIQALSPALDLISGSPDGANKAEPLGEEVLSVLVVAQPWLAESEGDLQVAHQARDRIDIERLSPRLAGWLSRLDRYLPWFESATTGSLLAPEVMGVGGSRTYLVVAQNSDELRPTGGFMSGVGEMRIERGRITSLTFQDSYAVDNFQVPHEVPPLDFQRTLFGQLWLFRDANWDADFPTSAERALQIYARDRGIRADGVIALDLLALKLLVRAVEPLQVEGIGEDVTSGNVLQVLRQQWSASEGKQWKEWWLHRKDVMGLIAGAAMGQLVEGQGASPVRLAQALGQALSEKHILVYMTDPSVAALLRNLNWDGGMPDPFLQSDWLLVVDSNVGFNKVDSKVERAIRYEVDLGAERGPRARLAVTYRNLSQRPVDACVQEVRYGDTYDDMMDRCYWDYSRVYAPAGSELLAGPNIGLPAGSMLARSGTVAGGEEAVSQALSSSSGPVWTAFFDLAPGQERSLAYDYQLPLWLLETRTDGAVRYRLRVQKQPGTETVPLRIRVLLPPGAVVVASTPPELGLQAGVSTDLRTDREFEIVYRDGANP